MSTPTSIPLLRDRVIARGERWIYCAGFNVGTSLSQTRRIDAELPDLRRLSAAGARVAVLSHQGSARKGDTLHLDYVADYLSRRLAQPVRYVPECVGPVALAAARALREGEIAVFGNTRHHAGEEYNDAGLARAFSELGDAVALGGFSKAHRAHASNIGLLRWRPGYVADSVAEELRDLAPWAGADPSRYSVAVVGGVKREKSELALPGFAQAYDCVIPGGTVLNALLRARGQNIGASSLGDSPEAALRAAGAVLSTASRHKLALPRRLVLATASGRSWSMSRVVGLWDYIRPHEHIVDFEPGEAALNALTRVVAQRGRLLVAGTPALVAQGFRRACDPIAASAREAGDGAIYLGGDTIEEMPAIPRLSAGGGAAITFLCRGSLPLHAALLAQGPRARDLR